MIETHAAHASRTSSPAARSLDYWVPMVLFGALTWGESYVPVAYFAQAYLIKAIAVTASLLIFRSPLADIRVRTRVILPSALLGLAVCALWLSVDRIVPYPHLGTRTAFDPSHLRGTAWWGVFLAARLYGLVVMVPIMEEIFWRSFLLRYLTDPNFRRLPVGTFSAFALWVMVLASALSHPEWLVAAIASLAYAFWLRRTGSLFGSIVAHAATNAALGAYVLATGAWQYW